MEKDMISNEAVARRKPLDEPLTVKSVDVPGVAKTVKFHEHHTILRTISQAPNGIDHFSAIEVDNYLASWLASGWEIVGTHLLSYEKDGAAFAWFLVR